MSGGWQSRPDRGDVDSRVGTAVFGLLLIALGVAFFVSQQLRVDWAGTGWPLFVIVPGLFLLIAGLAIPSEAGLGMVIPGAIVTTVGLVLAFQQATGAWASWAYMWALVAPGSVGLGLSAHGLLHRRWELVDAGLKTAATGLGLFIGFGLFFESILDIDREASTSLLRDGMPILAIILGALIVLNNLLPSRKQSKSEPAANVWAPGSSEPPSPPSAPQG